MTCAEVERVLPELLDGASEGGRTNNVAFENAFDTHVRSCPDCSDLVSELKLIASEARQMAEAEEPAPRVWLNIASQLRAEGLIREPETPPLRPVLVDSVPRRGWSALWLAPVAAVLLAGASYVVSHRQPTPVAHQQPLVNPSPVDAVATPVPPPQAVAESPAATASAASTSAAPKLAAAAPADQEVAQQPVPQVRAARFKEEAVPTAEDRQFLSVVSTRAPSMRATYESQLKAVNTDIRETQAYVDQYPGDADARQHLMDAYQQKALLYQIALDRIQ
jgi:hypothetical protein